MKRSQHLIKLLKCILIIGMIGIATNIGNAQGGCFGASASQMSFSSSGGTVSRTIQHSCSGGRFTIGNKPNWLTVSISGSRVTATAPAYSGAQRIGHIVLLYNGSTSGGISVVQNKGVKPPPPPPCTITGFNGSTFSATGQTKNYTLSYSNCPSNIYFTFKRIVNGQEQNLPSWVQVSQPSSGRVSVTFSRNSGTSSRNIILIGKRQDGGTPGIGGTFVQHCAGKTWYADSDNDGFRDPGSKAQVDCANRGSGWTQNTTVDVCPSEYNTQNKLKNWYRDTDNDGYRDPNGEMRSQCNEPTNGHWTLSTKNDQCPLQPGPGSGTNGCDPDCASGYLRKDGTNAGPPSSKNIPVQFSFSEDGGTAWVEMVFPDGSCASPYNPVFENVPGWLTLTHQSGNRIKLVCSAYTTRGGGRRTLPPVRVKVINDAFIGNISVEQDGPPLPCTVSGSMAGTFGENGGELTFPLTYDNCSGQTTTYDIKRSDGGALPDWATVVKDGPDEITIRLDRNDGQSSRTLTVVATGTTDPSLSVGGQLTQSCDLRTWYRDKDNDGWADLEVEACSRPTPAAWYKSLADIEGTGDCDDDDPSINPGTIWYEDTDGDNYKDSNGQVVEACSSPEGNWTNSPESVDDQCPNQSAPGFGTNGCDPDCTSGYLREDGTGTGAPASTNIPVQFSFSEDGGTAWVEMVFLDGSCASPYNPVFEDVPGWLTLTHESGNRIKLVCSAYTTRGGERRTLPPVKVKVINDVFIGNISVEQDGPPLPCTVSGSIAGTFGENGGELTFPLTYNNCSGQTNTYGIKRADGSALPDWVTVVKDGPDEITIRLDRNDGQSSRTLTVVATGITDPSLSIGGQLTQSCDLRTWYRDKDNDGWADLEVEACSRPVPTEWYKASQDIEGTGDCDDDDPSINAGTTWYEDTDNDGFRDPDSVGEEDCNARGIGWTQNTEEDVCPSNYNIVNVVPTWYWDVDGDEHAADQTTSCESPGSGWTREQLPVDDCDDNAYSPENTCTPSGNLDALDRNYIYTRTYQQARNTVPDQKFDEGDNGVFDVENDYVQDITYFDGLGRPMQQIGIRQSPKDEKDIVTHMAYDDFGRVEKEWLPFHEPESTVGSYRYWDVEEAAKKYYKNHPMYGDDFTGLSEGDVNPYSQKEFETSPLNRVLKQAAPGEDWKLIKNSDDHSIEFAYESNTHDPLNTGDPTKDNVSLFVVDLTGGLEDPALADGGFYTAGELFKNVTRDENHTSVSNKLHTTEEFTDKQGRVVLKRTYANLSHLGGDTEGAHDTYYVYDDHGNLTYVLPPKMEASTASLTDINTYMAELGYQYVYDHLNRLVEKQLPGKGREYIIYNKLDQPVMTQDANLRANNQWLFTKYDAHGRVAYTGLYTHTGSISRADMQSDLDGHYVDGNGDRNDTAMYEERDNADASNYNYTNNTFPTADLDILTVNYYDDYDFDRAGTGETATALGVTSAPYVKGLATGSKVKVLDPSASPGQADWITTVNYYDAKGRPIHTYSHNTYLGTVDIVETQLDFIGKPVKVRTGHTRNGVTIVTIDNFSYDHVGRLLAQTQCIGDGTLGDECPAVGNLDADLLWDGLGTIDSDIEATLSITVRNADIVPGTDGTTLRIVDDGGQELIVYNNYDELGQLVHKKVGGTPGSAYSETQGLQEVDYTYNVRGWLTDINDISDAVPNKLFNFSLSYDQSPDPLYNGNISQTRWRTASTDNALKSYSYTYDALNRIIGARDNTGNYDLGGFDASGHLIHPVTYDKNGNILALHRQGHNVAAPVLGYDNDNDGQDDHFGAMDVLEYAYHNGQMSNRLYKVRDDGEDAHGFKDGSGDAQDYWYDANGNLTSDANKDITAISYNHLNLPVSMDIDGGTIDYVYDAAGTKLKKTVSTGTVTEYAGDYVYSGNSTSTTLQFFGHPEGYVNVENNGYRYVYQYTDHLGNVRVSYTDDPSNPGQSTIIEENNYYPFGLKHKGYNSNINGEENNYMTYNGKELEESLGLNWLHYGNRNYMPDIGRWGSIDQLSEVMPDQGTFNYAFNSPLYYTDTDGNAPKGLNNPIVIFRRNENKVYIYEDNDTPFDFTDDILLGTYNAHNLVVSTSNGIWPDGIFRMFDRFKPHTHPYLLEPSIPASYGRQGRQSMFSDSRNGAYGELGIYRVHPFRDNNGIRRTGMGFHAGREYKDFFKRVTNGCIRCEPDFFAGIADAIEAFGPWNISIVETETGSQTNNPKVDVTPQPITPIPVTPPTVDPPNIVPPVTPTPAPAPAPPPLIIPPRPPDSGF
ncbi:DUF6443 domain-containing protein [Ulvibacterium sp.]|uniref:DUF6443 domain-containing protein n=1 Tax=Ulvibacterium sp. TaxID=2665914 RepID=UPI003BA8FA88